MNPWTGAIVGLTAALHAAPASAQADLFLEVRLNGKPTGQILRFREGPRGLRTSAASLRELGLDLRQFGLRGDEDSVELSALPGLRYQYDRASQGIALQLDDALREPVRLDARPNAAPPQQRATPGLVLNYDLIGQIQPRRSAIAFNELRFFNESGVLSSTGLLSVSGPNRDYMRYESSWSWSDPATLEALKLGDTITSSLPWSRSVRIGGIQWRKSFDLRPDLITYPMTAVAGSAVVPSALSVYINGIQQFGTTVPAGPYVVNRVAGFNGAGQATVVTRDEMGRSTVLDVPLYLDTRMLAASLTEYSLETGFMRRDYATRNFSYRGTPLGSASLRHGWSNSLTLEAHAEAGANTAVAGGGALLALGRSGVLNASASASKGGGVQGGLGYQYLSRRFSVELQGLRASAAFRDLANIDGVLPPRRSDRASLILALDQGSSASASYIAYDTPQAQPARVGSLSWSSHVARSVFLTVSAFKDFRQRASKALFFNLSTSFGERTSANASAGRQNGLRQRAISLVRPPDFEGGAGWSLQQGSIGSTDYRQAQVQYLGRYGQASATYQRSGQSDNLALELAGALVAMDGAVAAARSVGTGFALVSTGFADIPVVHENRILGKTGHNGYLLVPNLSPYAANRISLDVTQIAPDINVGKSEAIVAPRNLSGMLLQFPMSRYQAASIVLTDEAGNFLPPGTPVRHIESGAATVVGYDGVVFIDGLLAMNHLEAGSGEALCSASFAYQPAQHASITRVGPLACLRRRSTP